MGGNEKADHLAKERTDVDGGQTAAAKALTIKQPKKDKRASIGYAAQIHVQVDEWTNRDDRSKGKKTRGNLCRESRSTSPSSGMTQVGSTNAWHVENTAIGKIPGTHRGSKWKGKDSNVKLKKMEQQTQWRT